MAGKSTVICSRRLHYAMDKLSKNFLIDLVIDGIIAEIGEGVSDEQIADALQSRLETISLHRKDRVVSLRSELARLDKINEGYLRQFYSDLAASGGIVDAP